MFIENLILLDGRHEFPFSFQLPQEPLVTSFTGKYGSIQYYVKAVLERPAVPDQSVQTELQIISHIDVSSPALLTPVLRSQEKMVGCWFFTSGPVSLSAKIERKGYCNGEAIPIYAEIENCSSRLIVPKAAIFQTQTYLASGKTKTFRQMVANVRGNHIASGSTDTWNGKTLKIPPVSPSILDCCIIRVEYSLAVYIHIPGAKKLMIEMPLVIGTIPCIGFSSRNSSITSQFSMDMSWLALTMPEHPEAPPNYADIVSEEEFSRHVPAYPPPIDCEEQLCCPVFAYIQEFRFQPPPLYSEINCGLRLFAAKKVNYHTRLEQQTKVKYIRTTLEPECRMTKAEAMLLWGKRYACSKAKSSLRTGRDFCSGGIFPDTMCAMSLESQLIMSSGSEHNSRLFLSQESLAK
ncbi:hypothetical protein IHE44_0002848 [Lamprotornis superbus]|uniref:Arrestin C-terminal-like domain-containing protein n=1 Tax=Lamprotornis superbus TaxID=245042 RepID=A0A835U3U2_9PASS|nr:hypothetical protein IHE44_0002848 [Lamprotornis superbus]